MNINLFLTYIIPGLIVSIKRVSSLVHFPTTDISRSAFVGRRRSCTTVVKRRCIKGHLPSKTRKHGDMTMLRNVDLPEALIFYGMDTVIEDNQRIRPGVLRVMKEAQGLDVPIIVLSERWSMKEIGEKLERVDESKTFQQLLSDNLLHYRSSLEEFVFEGDQSISTDDDVSSLYQFVGKGVGHAPCPAALYDALHTIVIEPKGFGGSSGFGVKKWEATRVPLPQHCVVFVCSTSDKCESDLLDRSDGSGSISRDRCIAARYCGMRVIYIEDDDNACTAEDVADGIVKTLGTEHDWEMVTLDDISTPGGFWLNMMQPKDENGFSVQTETVIKEYVQRRNQESLNEKKPFHLIQNNEEEDEEELARILADIDPLG